MSTPATSMNPTRGKKPGGGESVALTNASGRTAATSRQNSRANTFGGRSNVRATDQNRRPVFKATLDAPYNIHW